MAVAVNNTPVKLLLTTAEAAEALGLCRSAVYELLLVGEIASVKIGRARRVPVKALEDFIVRRLSQQQG
jgi:excisionase family DNA binding protein